MEIEIVDGTKDKIERCPNVYAYNSKECKVYEIWASIKTYIQGGCMGKMRYIMSEGGSILEDIYPMMPAPGDYDIVTSDHIEEYKLKLAALKKFQKK